MSDSNFLQKRCPTCGRTAIAVARDKLSTRKCPKGHTWIPVKNPEPVPDEPTEPEEELTNGPS